MTQHASALARIESAVRREVDDNVRAYATELVLRAVEMDIADHALQRFTADAERILEAALQEAQRLVADRLREDHALDGVPDGSLEHAVHARRAMAPRHRPTRRPTRPGDRCTTRPACPRVPPPTGGEV